MGATRGGPGDLRRSARIRVKVGDLVWVHIADKDGYNRLGVLINNYSWLHEYDILVRGKIERFHSRYVWKLRSEHA